MHDGVIFVLLSSYSNFIVDACYITYYSRIKIYSLANILIKGTFASSMVGETFDLTLKLNCMELRVASDQGEIL